MVRRKENANSEILSEEANNIIEAYRDYLKKHNGRCYFCADFGAIDGKGNIIDDRIVCFGFKEIIKIGIDGLNQAVDKEDEFLPGYRN